MESRVNHEASRFLREIKNHRRWLAVFCCLALIVAAGTVMALKYTGSAMTHTQQVLNCKLQVHQHTGSCYGANGELVCGQADYVVHTHNDDCYDAVGNLVCQLPEKTAHKHSESCWTDVQTLICTIPEAEAHAHSEACYASVQGELICTDESEEHQHTDECYAWTQELVCGLEETEGHTHGEACYTTEHRLTCKELELHVHTASCYAPDANGNPIKPNAEGKYEGTLICGIPQLENHVHSSECLETVEMSNDEIESMAAAKASQEAAEAAAAESQGESAAAEEGGKNFFTTEDPDTVETVEAESTETSEAPEGNGAAEEATEAPGLAYSQTFEGPDYTVIVRYGEDAGLPDTAELHVTEYGKDSEEFAAKVEETGIEYERLFNIGFYVGDEEVEPAAEVEVSIRLNNTDDVTVTHFTDEGAVEMDSVSVDGAVVFNTDSFSDFGLVFNAPNYGISTYAGGSYSVAVGSTITITGTRGYSHRWSSSDTRVATVSSSDRTATVTGKKAGTATITHRYWGGSETFTVTVTAASSGNTTIKVPVYATDGHTSGTIDNTALKEILGLSFQQADNYFPVGVVELPLSLFTGKTSPYINSEADLNAVLNAISQISTAELQNDGAANKNNTVAENLKYVQLDINGYAGSLKTALFNWNMPEYDNTDKSVWSNSGNTNIAAPSSADGTWNSDYNRYFYKYHLDIRFATAAIQYIGVYPDGSTVNLAEGVYLAGHEILEPEASNLAIPDGYTAEGYFNSHSGALNNTSGDAYEFGGTMDANTTTTVYVRLVQRIDITAAKVWTDSETVASHPEVVLTLYKTVEGVTTSAGRTITLDGVADTSAKDDKETEPWKAEFRYLPKYEDGKEVTYSVEEDVIPSGYHNISTTGNETDGFVVVNEPYTPGEITNDTVDNGYKVDKTIEATDVENEYEITLTIHPSIQWPSEDEITSETFEEVLRGSAVWIINSNNSGFSVANGLTSTVTASEVKVWANKNIGGGSNTAKLCDTLQEAQQTENATQTNGNKPVSYIRIADTDVVVAGSWFYSIPQNSENSFTILIIPKNGDPDTKPVLKIGDVSYDKSTKTLTLPKAAYEWLSENALQYVTGTHLVIDDWDRAVLNVPDYVVDPMGDYIDFLNFVQLDGTNGTTNPIQSDFSKATYFDTTTVNGVTSEETIIWDSFIALEKDSSLGYQLVELENGHSIYYYNGSYTMTYRVRVDVLKDGFVSNTDYDANKPTYVVDGEEEFPFPIPPAKGYLASLKLVKEGDDGAKLQGVTFTLTCTQSQEVNPVAYNLTHPNALTATTDANGELVFDKLPWGDYVLTETNVPAGYLAIDPINITVAKGKVTISDTGFNAAKQTLTVVDPSNTAAIEVYKIGDGSLTGLLGGAEFEVTGFEDRWISSSAEETLGLMFSGDLKEGTYTLTEMVAPDGYKLAEATFVITITRDAAANAASVSLSYNGQEQPDMIQYDAETGVYKIYISNISGTLLPHTGGMGTTAFTIAGIAVIAAGLFYGFLTKRKPRMN